MVESYFPGTVPAQCFDKIGAPTVKIRVDKAPSTTIAELFYDDYGIMPILIPANSYAVGDTFLV